MLCNFGKFYLWVSSNIVNARYRFSWNFPLLPSDEKLHLLIKYQPYRRQNAKTHLKDYDISNTSIIKAVSFSTIKLSISVVQLKMFLWLLSFVQPANKVAVFYGHVFSCVCLFVCSHGGGPLVNKFEQVLPQGTSQGWPRLPYQHENLSIWGLS